MGWLTDGEAGERERAERAEAKAAQLEAERDAALDEDAKHIGQANDLWAQLRRVEAKVAQLEADKRGMGEAYVRVLHERDEARAALEAVAQELRERGDGRVSREVEAVIVRALHRDGQ